MNIEIWTKYIFIAAYALVTATYDKTIVEVANDDALGTLVKHIMREIALIAMALKVHLPSDIVDTSLFEGQPVSHRNQKHPFSGMWRQRGAKVSGICSGGTVIRYAEKLDIPTEHTKETYDRLLRKLEIG